MQLKEIEMNATDVIEENISVYGQFVVIWLISLHTQTDSNAWKLGPTGGK